MKWIETYQIQILETLIILAILFLIHFIFRKWSFSIAKKLDLGIERRKITNKIMNVLIISVGLISVMGVWGLDQKEFFLFLTSTLTVLGIGFFAQWSILSNITSGLMLYFNHPLHIGDTIKILDKDFEIVGTLKDITLFFMHIETIKGENITVPNSIVTQKTIAIIETKKSKSLNNTAEKIQNSNSN